MNRDFLAGLDLGDDNDLRARVRALEDMMQWRQTHSINLLENGVLRDLMSDGFLSVFPFGNGADGDVEISSNATLTRDMYYGNLTITNGASVQTDGYKIFVAGKLQIDAGARLHCDGGGGGGSGGGVAGLGGSSVNIGAINSPRGANGTAGGTAAAAGYSLGLAGTVTDSFIPAVTSSFAPFTWQVGCGGTGGGGHGAGALLDSSNTDQSMFHRYAGGRGGHAAGTGITQLGGGGGGGGAGILFLTVYELDNAGVISASGGAGGNGQTVGALSSGNGGGGGGGTTIIFYHILSGSGIGTRDVSGGAAGTGGNGGSSGNNGQNYSFNI